MLGLFALKFMLYHVPSNDVIVYEQQLLSVISNPFDLQYRVTDWFDYMNELMSNELINVDDTNELPNVVSRRTRKCYPWASIATVSWIVSGVFSSLITNSCLSEFCVEVSRWD